MSLSQKLRESIPPAEIDAADFAESIGWQVVYATAKGCYAAIMTDAILLSIEPPTLKAYEPRDMGSEEARAEWKEIPPERRRVIEATGEHFEVIPEGLAAWEAYDSACESLVEFRYSLWDGETMAYFYSGGKVCDGAATRFDKQRSDHRKFNLIRVDGDPVAVFDALKRANIEGLKMTHAIRLSDFREMSGEGPEDTAEYLARPKAAISDILEGLLYKADAAGLLTPAAPRWLVDKTIAAGHLSLLIGDSFAGKSTLSIRQAADAIVSGAAVICYLAFERAEIVRRNVDIALAQVGTPRHRKLFRVHSFEGQQLTATTTATYAGPGVESAILAANQMALALERDLIVIMDNPSAAVAREHIAAIYREGPPSVISYMDSLRAQHGVAVHCLYHANAQGDAAGWQMATRLPSHMTGLTVKKDGWRILDVIRSNILPDDTDRRITRFKIEDAAGPGTRTPLARYESEVQAESDLAAILDKPVPAPINLVPVPSQMPGADTPAADTMVELSDLESVLLILGDSHDPDDVTAALDSVVRATRPRASADTIKKARQRLRADLLATGFVIDPRPAQEATAAAPG